MQKGIERPAEHDANRNRDHPGGDNATGHSPTNRRRATGGADAHNRRRDTWVVETGMPIRLAISMIVAAAVSAANPSIGRSSTTFNPIVLMIRQPPVAVPKPMAVAAERTTQSGMPQSLPDQPS